MADLTRVHPVATPTFPVSMAGSTENITYVEIDYLAAVNAKTGPESTLAAVVKMLGTFGTVIYQGPLFDSNTKQIIGIEGYGLEVVERIPIKITPTTHNKNYLNTKAKKLGHMLDKNGN